ncbi:hypothetical protein ACIBEF_30850 [Micromonospora sp. NPDC050795]|uniref:hypothetical protein n=1 Tax=Micromonospora sp. NPDC050795 TaxID=3364282 RepID=UPI0037BB02B3
MQILRSWWRVRYPVYALGLVVGMVMLWLPFAGAPRQAEVGCWEVCLAAGSAVRIWVNPDDPDDFVTDFGILSGHRGRLQGVVGAAGLVLSGWMALAVIAHLYQQRRGHRRQDWQRQQRDQRQRQFANARAGTKRKPGGRGTPFR